MSTINIEVRVKTSARHVKLERLSASSFSIAVKAKPQDGQANLEIIKTLAKFFSVPQSAVTLLHGHGSKRKLFEIVGLTDPSVASQTVFNDTGPVDGARRHDDYLTCARPHGQKR